VATKGRGYGGWIVAGILVMIFLVSTDTWNPFPDVWRWANTSRGLSDPAPSWQERIGGRAETVTLAGNTLVVELHTSVEARRVSDGGEIWTKKADWSSVAGEGAGAVAVVGKLLVKGYDVIDPGNGAVLRHNGEAVGVWTYRDAIVDARCHSPKDCTLTAYAPRDGDRLWQVDIPGIESNLVADNPGLRGTRPLTTSRVADHPDSPEEMPRLLGFPVGEHVYPVDTSDGRRLPEVKQDSRDQVVVAGGRVLRVTANPSDGACYFTVDARDAVTGGQVWKAAGLNLRTTSGSGCQQRRAPAGAGNVVVGVSPDGREAVLDANDGRALWVGGDKEKVLAVDNRYALVRAADGRSVKGIRLGRAKPLWTRAVHPDAEAALTAFAAVIVDKKPDRIIALDPASGAERLNVRSEAKVVTCGPSGIVISEVRELGYLPYTSGAVATEAPAGGGPVEGAPANGGSDGDGPAKGKSEVGAGGPGKDG
jgi:outer membrane protein assembly factor BamB